MADRALLGFAKCGAPCLRRILKLGGAFNRRSSRVRRTYAKSERGQALSRRDRICSVEVGSRRFKLQMEEPQGPGESSPTHRQGAQHYGAISRLVVNIEKHRKLMR